MADANALTGSTSLDPTIPLKAGVGVTPLQNPLATMGQFMQLRALQNQNELFPGQQQIQQQTIQKGDLDIGGAKTDLARKNLGAVTSFFGPAIAAGDKVTTDQITNGFAGAQAAGLSPDALIADFHANGGGDAASQAAWLRSRFGPGLSNQQIFENSTPSTTLVQKGNEQVPYTSQPRMAPNVGAMAPAGPGITNGLSPSEATAPTKIGVDAQGHEITGTRQMFIDKATGSPSPFGDGRLPSALRGPNAPKPTGIVTSLSPSEESAQNETGASSAKAFNDYADQGVASKTRAAALDNMLGDTANFTTGPMADQIAKLRAVAQRFHVNVDADALSSAESFNKLAAQLAAAQSGGTDKSLGNSMAANPHIDLSPNGVDMMLRQLRGNEDYLQARSQLAASYGDKSDRAGFEAKIGAKIDPRVFQYERMTPEQKGTFLNSMKDAGAFIKAHKWAESQHLIGG